LVYEVIKLRSIEGNLKDCINKIEIVVFKKYFDLVDILASCIDELQKSNKDCCQGLMNAYSNKKELLDALEEDVKCLSL
jgi:hypothetical protein